MVKRFSLFIMFAILFLLFASCANINDLSSQDDFKVYEVNPLFRETYEAMGGQGLLGAAITPLFSHDNKNYQYTVSTLMVFDPLVSEDERFSLAALGEELNLLWVPSSSINPTSPEYTRQFEIFNEFMPIYKRLGGMKYVGQPITGAHYNPQLGRFEQFFKTIGIYRPENASPGSASLLALGCFKCGKSCSYLATSESVVNVSKSVDEHFLNAVIQFGSEFTGLPITDAYWSVDGDLEQVFENVVMAFKPGENDSVSLKPLSMMIGIKPDSMDSAVNIEGEVFIDVDGGYGYQVPNEFLNYINKHGGMAVTGLPSGKFKNISDSVKRQCFENICMVEDQRVGEPLRIRPFPLGHSYAQLVKYIEPTQENHIHPDSGDNKNNGLNPESTPTIKIQSIGDIVLQVWEVHPWVAPDQSQELIVSLYINQQPVTDAHLVVVVYLPEGQRKTYPLPLTDATGQTTLKIEPINAPSGTLIPYQVCILLSGGEIYCIRDDFLIWIA